VARIGNPVNQTTLYEVIPLPITEPNDIGKVLGEHLKFILICNNEPIVWMFSARKRVQKQIARGKPRTYIYR
jgi:hypothetical protein